MPGLRKPREAAAFLARDPSRTEPTLIGKQPAKAAEGNTLSKAIVWHAYLEGRGDLIGRSVMGVSRVIMGASGVTNRRTAAP